MVDRTQMIEFATRVRSDIASDSTNDRPVGVASPGEFTEFPEPEAAGRGSDDAVAEAVPEEINATLDLEAAPAEIGLAVRNSLPMQSHRIAC